MTAWKQYDWVNPKQAQRMLIVRAKRAALSIKRIKEAAATNLVQNVNVATVKFTKPRMKNAVRQKVARERVRD
jgi:hypothetical protein